MNHRLFAVVILAFVSAARADEGMWTLDNLPAAQLKEKYGFVATPEWLEHVRLASVRFNDGGSGAFVSPDGLVITNHHVAFGQLQKVSSEKTDYAKNGFFARSHAQEMKCPDLEINQLVSMEDVTARVLGAIRPEASDKDQNAQRKAEMSRVEKESTEKTGFRSDVVELYNGGEYWLYRYKKYTDIRLVMAPEQQAAFFGGDPDNFTYPRFDLDMAFFRVYENGKPVKSTQYFRWSAAGAKDGELTFVLGHPGSTDRLRTVSQLAYERDYALPTLLKRLRFLIKGLEDYSARGTEQRRRAKEDIFHLANSIKAMEGELDGLKDPNVMRKLEVQEKDLREGIARDPKLVREYGASWDKIDAAQKQLIARHKQMRYRSLRHVAQLVEFANTIVRYSAETAKPNDKRLEEFRDSALESLKFRLFSPAPLYPDLDEHGLASALALALQELGPDDEFVRVALGGQTPEAAARQAIEGTRLTDAAFRKALVEGGEKAVLESTDPLIVWARRIDPLYRELRKWHEDNIQSVEALEGNRIAKARFAVYGKAAYPDATFTLRLSYGKVAGYELGTTYVPYKTNFYGLYDRAASFDNRSPFDLPAAEAAAFKAVDLATPLNFVTTNDIIGGNSGSPVINREGEYVGLIFDGNIQGLVWRFAFDEAQGRAVAVHSSGILEGLRKIYHMGMLAEELTGAKPVAKGFGSRSVLPGAKLPARTLTPAGAR